MEAFELQPGVREIGCVGVCEVSEDAFHVDVLCLQRRFEQLLRRVPVDADALHPGIDLEMDARLHAFGGRHLVDGTQLVDG